VVLLVLLLVLVLVVVVVVLLLVVVPLVAGNLCGLRPARTGSTPAQFPGRAGWVGGAVG
jgi:hypothetical protein